MKKTFTKNYFLHFFLAVGILLGLSSSAFAATIPGEFNGWSKENAVIDNGYTVYLEANKEYKFKIEDWDKWNSYSQKVTKDNCKNLEFSQSVKDDAVILTDKAGNYAFKIERWNGSNPVLTVTYPTGDTPVSGDIYVTGDAFAGWGTFVPMVKEANNRYSAKVTGSGSKFKVSNKAGYNDDFHKNVGANNGVSKDNNGGDATVTKKQGTVTIVYFDPTAEGGKGWLWADYIDFSLKASSHSRYDSDVDPITLTAQGTSVYDSYTWQVSNDNSTWTDLGVTTTGSFTLQGSDLPKETSYYRVIGKGTGSETFASAPIVISVLAGCGEGTRMEEIFKMDFGTLSGEKARKDVEKATMATNYKFRDWPKKIDDKYYAIVATPYYTGCGDAGGSYKDPNGDVSDACLSERAWYRKYLYDGSTPMRDRDYMNGKNPAVYGGMLMINFDNYDANNPNVFVRTLSPEDKGKLVKNARLCFSAWFASAAQPYNDVAQEASTDIYTIISIEYRKDANSPWTVGKDEDGNPSRLESQVTFEQDWVYVSTDMLILETEYEYRIVITNQNKSGVGNDVLIDDIQLHMCKPVFNVYFKDKDNNNVEELTYAKVDSTTTFVVKNQNFGSITEPCIMLFEKRDNRSKFLGNMAYDVNTDQYLLTIDNTDLVEELPQEFEYYAVVSQKADNGECDINVQMGVINGTILPGQNPWHVFSDNTIKAQIGCGTSKLSNPSDITKICVATDDDITLMPTLKLESKNVGSTAYVDVLVDNEPFVSQIAYKEDVVGCGYMSLDLNKLYEDANGEPYKWETGVKTITAKVVEHYIDLPYCERKAEDEVKINVVARPTVKALVSAVFQNTTCEGESTILAVTADNAIAYQWEMLAPNTTNWVKVGSGADTLQTSLGMLNETQYRVKLENDSELHCGIVSDPITMYVKACDDLTLSQYVTTNVCKGDTIAYTINLKNHAAGNAYNVVVNADWDNAKLVYEKANAPEGTSFDADTKVWTVGTMKSKQELSLTIFMVLKDESQASYEVKSFVSSLNETRAGEYDRQSDPNMKGTSDVVLNGKAPNPVPKRKQMENAKDEIFSYNQCPIAKIVKFDELIKGDGFDMTLVWVDAEGNLIENPSFDANVPIEDGVAYVYNAPEGMCQSDIIEVHYRVKKVTPVPVVSPYEACALTGTAEEVQLSLMDRIKHPDGETYKYVAFYDENDVEVTSKTFDASKPGTTTYTVKVSMDEINSQSNNYCEAQATFTVTVKDYAVSAKIIANGTSVCPNTEAVLTASSSVSNPIYHWHQLQQDGSYTMVYTGATYTTPVLTKSESYKVTVTGANLCEQSVDEGKVVEVTMLTKITGIELTPATSDFVIGGNDVKTLTIIPADAVYSTIWTANGKQIEVETNGNVQNTIERPYVDTEYQVEVIGECSRDTVYATTTVVWPTVFTPYVLDGLNDTFVQNMNPNFHTLICNRFGMPVVETDNGWDGKLSNGDIAVPGVYYYVVTLPDGNVKKGTIEVYKR